MCECLVSESSGKSEVLETGYSVDRAKKKTKYVSSELRLIETMDGLCEKLLEYNIHKERKDVTRFARGTSETFQVNMRRTHTIQTRGLVKASQEKPGPLKYFEQ